MSKLKAVEDRNGLLGAGLLGKKAGQDVRVVLAGQRNDSVVAADVFFFEKRSVGDIAKQHQHALEFVGEFSGSFFAAVDDGDDMTFGYQCASQNLAGATATEHHDAVSLA